MDMGTFTPRCTHPRDKCSPVMGKICTYLCDQCGVEFTRTASQQEAPGEAEGAEPPDLPGMDKMDADQFAMAVTLLNMAATAFAPWREHMMKQGAQPEADILLAMAMASYAGTIYGQLVVSGVAKDSAQEEWLDTMRANAQLGIKAGKKQATLAVQEALAEMATPGKPS